MRCGIGRATFMETSIFVSRLGSTIFPFRRLRFMETSIFVTDLAQQFSLSVVGPSHPAVVPLRVTRAGRRGFSDPWSFLPYRLVHTGGSEQSRFGYLTPKILVDASGLGD
jgi:hypothetical protein